MLDPRWRKVLRDIWLHRARSMLVILAIAVGLIGAGAILNAWALVQRATEQGYNTSLPASATLTIDHIDAELIAAVRASPEIGGARARRSVIAAAEANGTWHTAVLVALDDFENTTISRLSPDGGSWPPPEGAIVIERSSLEFSGATLGEPITLKLGKAQPQSLSVSGIVRDVSLAPGWMEHVVYAYATPATLAKLGAPADFNELQIRVRNTHATRDEVRRTAYDLKSMIERGGLKVSNIEVPEPGEHIHAAQMDSMLMTQGTFGLLALIVCMFLVVNLITAMLVGQSREIGVMKTLGASSAQIAAMYLSLASMFGALASLIALPAAVVLGRLYAGFRAEMLNFPIAGYGIPGWVIALQIAVGCLLPVAAAAIPVARACRISVGSALRDIGIVAQGSSLHTHRRIPFDGLSRPLLLSIGNAFRRRQRMLLTLLALVAGGAVFLGAQNLRVAVRGSVDLLFASQHYDVMLRLADPARAAVIESTARSIDGVERAEAWRSARASLAHADGTESDHFSLVTLPAQTQMLVPKLESGRWLNSTDQHALVISRSLLRQESILATGNTAQLHIDGGTSRWVIVGVVDSGPQPIAYAPRAAFDAMRGNQDAASLVVAIKPRGLASQLDVIQRLRSVLEEQGMPIANSQMLSENRRVIEDHLLMVVDFLGAMAWVMIIVGGMGLASTMSLGVLERTREIGVLRAIGAGHRAIMMMIQIEGLVIALLSWLIALPLSIPMSLALGDAFGRIMFKIPTHYLPDLGATLSWLVLIVVVSLIASAWPAWRATRVSVAAALSYA
jgi:putative ABC transport system permease protein